MTARTMARFHRAETPHTDWCARDHRCGIDVHRSPEFIADGPIGGRAVMTRVRVAEVDYAEIRIRVPLSRTEDTARRQLGTALHLCRELLAAIAAIRPPALRGRAGRPALDRKTP
ncbi:hypothetical protein [Actinoplanes derwentensis]|uniref:Uncharacterized protein n=1 Tax=Actinoplanes derwentensis TaxID=113562 RepID=A0A1H2CIL3_9ACTN|nr:hypothetical protein [Actinoplanes derwentensis]GID82554.1 hypothetical protein Ade03nite_14780 [Actinoplanes derwentensis]SDT70338.1 hypothetical protein SAMN04489716_5933 [Actinoplanes derwentensis]